MTGHLNFVHLELCAQPEVLNVYTSGTSRRWSPMHGIRDELLHWYPPDAQLALNSQIGPKTRPEWFPTGRASSGPSPPCQIWVPRG